jgi:hypothetical protein
MSNEQFHIGNRRQAELILTELLPDLERMILNANKEFFTISETMRVLSISRTQLYYLRVKGLLEYKHVGRKVYITRRAIHNLVMGNGKLMDIERD